MSVDGFMMSRRESWLGSCERLAMLYAIDSLMDRENGVSLDHV